MPKSAKAFQSDVNPLILDPVLPRSQTIIEEFHLGVFFSTYISFQQNIILSSTFATQALSRTQIIEEQCFTWKTCSLYVSSSTCTRDGSLVGETMKKTTGENLKLS